MKHSSDHHYRDEGFEQHENYFNFQAQKAFNPSQNPRLNLNNMWSLPHSLVGLIGLVKLEATNIHLSDLPDQMGCLRNLKHLDISYNSVSWLPKSFSELPSLEYFNVSNNNLLMLPLDIGRIMKQNI